MKLSLIAAAAVLGCTLPALAQSDFYGTLTLTPTWTHSKTAGVSVVAERFLPILSQAHAYGTNANQMTLVVQLAGSLTNGQEAVYELADPGVANSFGDVVAFDRVNVLAIKAAASNLGDVLIGAAAATPFASWLSDTNTYAIVKPGGLLLLTAPDAAGYSCASGSMRVANGSTNDASYQLYVGGAQ